MQRPPQDLLLVSRHEDGVSSILERGWQTDHLGTSTTSARGASQKSMGEPSASEKVICREQYGKFDSGGIFWIITVRRQVFALITAQLVLAGVTAVNVRPARVELAIS